MGRKGMVKFMAAEEKNFNTNIDEDGNVCISNEVVATIASITAQEVNGVNGMAGSIKGDFVELLGRKNPGKGVKVSVTGREVVIDMFIIVDYGVKIPDVAWEVQEKTKNEVEAMTGLDVVAVNVNIEGINTSPKAELAEDDAQDEADTEE